MVKKEISVLFSNGDALLFDVSEYKVIILKSLGTTTLTINKTYYTSDTLKLSNVHTEILNLQQKNASITKINYSVDERDVIELGNSAINYVTDGFSTEEIVIIAQVPQDVKLYGN